jgi:hypothetical protein
MCVLASILLTLLVLAGVAVIIHTISASMQKDTDDLIEAFELHNSASTAKFNESASKSISLMKD